MQKLKRWIYIYASVLKAPIVSLPHEEKWLSYGTSAEFVIHGVHGYMRYVAHFVNLKHKRCIYVFNDLIDEF